MKTTIMESHGYDILFAHDSCTNWPLHAHRYIELHYVEKGPFYITIGNTEHILHENSMVLVFPYQLHSTKQIIDGAVYTAIINIDVLEHFTQYLLTHTCNEPIIFPSDTAGIFNLFVDGFEIYKSKPVFSTELLYSIFSTIVGKALSALYYDNKLTQTFESKDSVFKLVEYCSQNALSPELTLSSVAKALGLNKYYISHTFSEKLGMTFNDFITRRRLSQVQQLLQYTDMSITDISYACGFNSHETFNRLFKNTFKTTPREYRKIVRKDT